MGLWPSDKNEGRSRCHPRERGAPLQPSRWIPAFAGMTPLAHFSGKARCRLAIGPKPEIDLPGTQLGAVADQGEALAKVHAICLSLL